MTAHFFTFNVSSPSSRFNRREMGLFFYRKDPLMNARFILLALMLSAFYQQVQAQALTEEEQKKKSRREQNFYFLQQTLNYARLSYACPPGFDRGSPKSWYILSSDVVPQFVIGGDWMAVPIHITPRYMVRIMHNNVMAGDSSMPVRTPSYMPGITFYFRTGHMDDAHHDIHYFSLTGVHHSNGQDGHEFVNDEINTYNGNFSTNYIEPAYHFRKRNRLANVLNKDGGFYQPSDYFDFYGRIGYEVHVNTTDELKNSYGGHRLNVTLGLVEVLKRTDKFETTPFYRERNRLVLNTTLIMGSRDRDLNTFGKRINVDLNYYWRVPSSPNTAVFVSAGYYGSDPYNIYYMNSYGFVRAGLAFGFFVAPITRGDKRMNVEGAE